MKNMQVKNENSTGKTCTESWKAKKLTETYLDGVRSAIPFANEQIEILIRIIRFFKPTVNSFLDLGCGDGVLGRMIFSNWSNSKGIFVDYSEPMIKVAKDKCREYPNRAYFTVQDFGNTKWVESISKEIPVDVVLSGFSIHHQSDDNKKRIYREIFDRILKPGGIFLNLEQVKSPAQEIEALFNEFFMDSMRKFQQENDTGISIKTIEKEFYKDKKINILAPVDEQCLWLKDIGFINVDCFFKCFEIAIFGGIKPR